MFKTKYRVVTDCHAGYEAQYKRWWMPFYIQISINTHASIACAVNYIGRHKRNNVVWESEEPDRKHKN